MAISEHPGATPERDPVLDRRYREAGSEGPPAHLDAVILAAAHREVGSRPRTPPGALRRWQLPVSLAAVIVLSVSLVTLVREEGGEQLIQPAVPSRPAEAPVPVPAPAASGEASKSSRREAKPSRATASAPADIADQRPARPPEASPPTGNLARDIAGAPGQPAAEIADRQPPAPAQRSMESAAAMERRSARQARSAEDAAAAPAPDATRPSSRLKAAEARKEAGASAAQAPIWQAYEQSPPQAWLERIAELRRQHQAADADAMLAEFRRRFPDHPLPPGWP